MKELCFECKPTNKCWFEEEVKKREAELPPFEQQTPIRPGSDITNEESDVSIVVAEMREIARKFACPNVNKVFFPANIQKKLNNSQRQER